MRSQGVGRAGAGPGADPYPVRSDAGLVRFKAVHQGHRRTIFVNPDAVAWMVSDGERTLLYLQSREVLTVEGSVQQVRALLLGERPAPRGRGEGD